VGVQEVVWDGSFTEPAGECTFLYGTMNWVQVFFYTYENHISA
jgi:hypothetical protein